MHNLKNVFENNHISIYIAPLNSLHQNVHLNVKRIDMDFQGDGFQLNNEKYAQTFTCYNKSQASVQLSEFLLNQFLTYIYSE